MLFALLLLGAAWGAATGSYLGCALWRIPRRIPLWEGRSHCPGCGVMVPGYRNIPVVSFLAQRGRAACCAASLSRGYLAAELGSTLAGAALVAGLYAALDDPAVVLTLMFPLALVMLLAPAAVSWRTADRGRQIGPGR